MKCIYIQAVLTISFIAFSILFGVLLAQSVIRRKTIATKGKVLGYSASERSCQGKNWTGYVDIHLYIRDDGSNSTVNEMCIESVSICCADTRSEAIETAERDYPFYIVDESHPLDNNCIFPGVLWFRACLFSLCAVLAIILVVTLIVRVVRKRRRRTVLAMGEFH